VTRVLVTGAGGLIGTAVADAARQAGYEVSHVMRQASGEADVVACDLRRPLQNVPPCDWVFHLAGGYAGAGKCALRRIDLKIARNLARWGRDNGVKNWVIASAAEVYGCIDGLGTEKAPTRPVIPYGAVKLSVEKVFTHLARPDGRLVLLRIGEVYGAKARLIRELTGRLKRGRCPWPGSGRIAVSFVHVSDVAGAFLCAVESAPKGVAIYNVADDEPATWRAFVCRIAELQACRPPLFLPSWFVRAYAMGHELASLGRQPVLTGHALRLLTTPKALSNRRIVAELGFKPRYPDWRAGLEATLHGLSHDTQDG
jgi:nucleoside-diphosphate-sugar epimerase